MRLSTDILLAEDEIQRGVAAMAAAIAADTPEGSRLSVIALMDGAFMFCSDLVRRLPMPVHLLFLPLTSVSRGGDPSRIVLPPEFPIAGSDVLVVEHVLESGRTLAALRGRLLEAAPRRVRIAVLLAKPDRRAVDLEVDYVGFATSGRHWVAGYGLDCGGLYRNLPYISHVERT